MHKQFVEAGIAFLQEGENVKSDGFVLRLVPALKRL